MLHSIIALLTFTIICLVIYLFAWQPCYSYFTMVDVKSDIDSITYPVVAKYEDNKTAANMIGDIHIFTSNLIKKLKSVYFVEGYQKNPEYEHGRHITTLLTKRFHHDSLEENDPPSADKTSYVINKGETISLCLREKQSGENKFHDLDILKFVMLHELSHMITVSIAHDIEFWTNFKFLLEFCNKHDLYKVPNYEQNGINYCGLPVTYVPSMDPKLKSYF